ncbi:hypothetical protein BCR32DRAFT_278691 [Anaeromyces robustus]|uniref:Uncharacterized protein n=1 Tax=Anaeromyces robustus TaxID=1754192 RepID=A0A1Y1XB86_9FUNG|nr:hypothetical protein BCR32DRAFT_278691 [Anaeromyces robustus]|eukprot:ORX82706.1 hypothetical protein BCR32DRAFT_278691 [Anaeromyces robustus]
MLVVNIPEEEVTQSTSEEPESLSLEGINSLESFLIYVNYNLGIYTVLYYDMIFVAMGILNGLLYFNSIFKSICICLQEIGLFI